MVAWLADRHFDYGDAYFTEEDCASGHRDFESRVAQAYDEARFLPELDAVEPLVAGRRVLDVGGATGAFAMLARRRGWDAVIMEPSEAARELAAAKGITSVATVEEAVDLGPFDLVTLHHVLEHVDDPVAFLAGLVPLLAVGGVVLVEVPNWRSTERMAAGPSWVDLRAEQHRWHFSPDPLRRTCMRAGLDVQHLATLSEPLPTLESTLLAGGIPAPAVAALQSLRTRRLHATESPLAHPESDGSEPAAARPAIAAAARLESKVLERLVLGKRLRVVARPVRQARFERARTSSAT